MPHSLPLTLLLASPLLFVGTSVDAAHRHRCLRHRCHGQRTVCSARVVPTTTHVMPWHSGSAWHSRATRHSRSAAYRGFGGYGSGYSPYGVSRGYGGYGAAAGYGPDASGGRGAYGLSRSMRRPASTASRGRSRGSERIDPGTAGRLDLR